MKIIVSTLITAVLLLVIMKLGGVIELSLIQILSPIWGFVLFITACFIVVYIKEIIRQIKGKK